jgi:RNA polymerase sigma-70 factor, ECF subfamily
MLRHMTESEIIDQAVAGDEAAWRILYDTHSSQVLGILLQKTNNREDAEDLMQATFLRAFKGLSRFKRESKLSTWLYTIAVHEFLMKVRRRKKHIAHAESLDELVDDGLSKIHFPVRDELLESVPYRLSLDRCTAQLPDGQREIVELRTTGYEHHEIAKILGVQLGTSKSQLYKAKTKLKALMNRRPPFWS